MNTYSEKLAHSMQCKVKTYTASQQRNDLEVLRKANSKSPQT